MLEKIKKLVTSKPVLLGGAGLAAVVAYLYFTRGSSGDGGDSVDAGYLDNAYPGASLVFGSGYPSSDTAANIGGLSAADTALIDLQKYAIQAESEKYSVERDIAVLDNNAKLKELEYSYGAADAAVTSKNYDTFTGMFDKFLKKGTGKKKIDTFTANIGGDIFSIDVDYEKKKKKKKDKDKTPKQKPKANKLFGGGSSKGKSPVSKLFSTGKNTGGSTTTSLSTGKSISNSGSLTKNVLGLTGGKVNVNNNNKNVKAYVKTNFTKSIAAKKAK